MRNLFALSFLQVPAEFRRGDTCSVTEEAGEVVGVAETELRGYTVD